jgi:hypothetical protein
VAPVVQFRVGAALLTRVQYFDVPLDAEVVSLTAAQVRSIDWATPSWATPEGQVLVGQALWVIESQGRVIVVDPCGAADAFIRSGPEAIGHQEAALGAMRAAGFPPERVDVVVLSHLDGIGMAAVVDTDGHWTPAFPNARIVMTTAELEYLAGPATAGGLDQLNTLIAQGAVDGVGDGHCLTTDVHLELTGAHSPGHAVVRVHSGGELATLIGHLALSPLHTTAEVRSNLHLDSARAKTVLDALVAEAAATESVLIGPLWPFPGAGYAAGGLIVAAAPQG